MLPEIGVQEFCNHSGPFWSSFTISSAQGAKAPSMTESWPSLQQHRGCSEPPPLPLDQAFPTGVIFMEAIGEQRSHLINHAVIPLS